MTTIHTRSRCGESAGGEGRQFGVALRQVRRVAAFAHRCKAGDLTAGVGKAQQIQFRVVRLGTGGGRGGRGGGGGRGGAAADEEGLDLSKPVLLSAYGDRTKKSGYWQVTAGQAPTPLVWADKEIGGAREAENADRVMFTEQTFSEFRISG